MDCGDERGQATVEWVGLLLALGLALGALAGGVRGAARGEADGAGASPAAGPALAHAMAERITCAARDLCRSERHAGGGERAFRGPAARGREGAMPGREPAVRGPSNPSGAPPSSRRAGRRARRRGPDAMRALRRVGRAAEGAWLACLGYRALEYDLEHPRTPRQMRPLDETLDIVNDCLNPWEFLFGG